MDWEMIGHYFSAALTEEKDEHRPEPSACSSK